MQPLHVKEMMELQTRRAGLRRIAQSNHEELERLEQEHEADYPDQAVEREAAGILRTLTDAEQLELQSIDAALDRIDRGTYGRCSACGEDIDQARLKALPEASDCIACAEARERAA